MDAMYLNSLISLAIDGDLKFVFVGGKGGVGKTTSSSAIATLLADCCNKRVLLISTDPAHSLSDAWRKSFNNIPTRVLPAVESPGPGLGPEHESTNDVDVTQGAGDGALDIMEVNPQDTMKSELEQWADATQQIFGDDRRTSNPPLGSSSTEWHSKMNQFQEWLSGIPGIDEATALSTAIQHIESGKYDIIVFDTAPTGHTVKLLALPEILQQGIDKLQTWQTTLWTYWESFKAGMGAPTSTTAKLKTHVRDKLTKYKHDIQKVAMMLQDKRRTRFIVVCIAEFLSVSETKRLLQELAKNRVVASHIIVNQLVVNDALEPEQLSQLESFAKVGNLQLPVELLQKTVHACRLTTARKQIQQRYLNDLKSYQETQCILDGICEVPMLAEEVTGIDAIQRFARMLVSTKALPASNGATKKAVVREKLYDEMIGTNIVVDSAQLPVLALNDIVQINGLSNSPQFNGLEGRVSASASNETGRYEVTFPYQGATKTLSLMPQNITLVQKSQKRPRVHVDDPESSVEANNVAANSGVDHLVNKAKAIMDDPDIRSLLETNPRFQKAVDDCIANPLNTVKYLGDPEMSPLVTRIMSKMGGPF